MSAKSLSNNGMDDSADDFEAMYEAHAPAIYRFLFWRTKNEALAEDLTSNVFEKAWRSRQSFRGGSAKAWLHRIARNTLIDHWRKKQDVAMADTDLLPESIYEPETEVRLDRALLLGDLKQALAKLPASGRQVIELRFLEGLPSRAVAAKLKLSESNVRVIQYRALKQLRDYLNEKG